MIRIFYKQKPEYLTEGWLSRYRWKRWDVESGACLTKIGEKQKISLYLLRAYAVKKIPI